MCRKGCSPKNSQATQKICESGLVSCLATLWQSPPACHVCFHKLAKEDGISVDGKRLAIILRSLSSDGAGLALSFVTQ